MIWDTVIGLEVHIQLKTRSKLFSGAKAHFSKLANTQTSFIDAGLPGVLPVLNEAAVSMAVQFGVATHASINSLSYFERKNYFYPDLPKGYQISQFQKPIVSDGLLEIDTPQGKKEVIIQRAHLEEDAGKSLHNYAYENTALDFNRAGIALLEVVTTPCLYSAQEAVEYLKTLRQLVCFLGICDGNMEEGSFRCDVNISLKPAGSTELGTRTELKNLNSFKFVEKAILFEEERHRTCLEQHIPLSQETRVYCPTTESTKHSRSKESEADYRYFPDPDLLPILIPAFLIEDIKNNMPILPQVIKDNLADTTLLQDDIDFLLSVPAIYYFFSAVKPLTKADIKSIVNWLKGPYWTSLKLHNLDFEQAPIPPQEIAILLDFIEEKVLSHTKAKQIFNRLWQEKDATVRSIVANSATEADIGDLDTYIENLIKSHPKQVDEYKQGKEKILGFFVGQIMKHTRGRVDPSIINQLLKKYLQ